MKKQSATLFATINKDTLADLTNEVKETIADGFNQPLKKIFTVAELWNIHRQRKEMVRRRFSV